MKACLPAEENISCFIGTQKNPEESMSEMILEQLLFGIKESF